MRTPAQLTLKPSQIAAACLTLAVNVAANPLAAELNFQPKTNLRLSILDSPDLYSLHQQTNNKYETRAGPE